MVLNDFYKPKMHKLYSALYTAVGADFCLHIRKTSFTLERIKDEVGLILNCSVQYRLAIPAEYTHTHICVYRVFPAAISMTRVAMLRPCHSLLCCLLMSKYTSMRPRHRGLFGMPA